MELTDIQTGTLREKTLEVAKRHKASWFELGQYLYTIYKDKHYKTWGYLEFETYVGKELHLKHTTAVKLLKSYYFLEKEEPKVFEEASNADSSSQLLPSYESVNLLRLAKSNKKLKPEDVHQIRKSVFDQGKEAREVKGQVRKMLSERDDRDPQEVRETRRNSTIRRLVVTLRHAGEELEAGKLLPAFLLKQIDELAIKLEDQLE